MIFGIWPGVVAADLVGLKPLDCPPEDTAKTLAALRRLQGTAGEFYVRAYRHFGEGSPPHAAAAPAPPRPELYAGQRRLVDLVACYQSPSPDPRGFADFVRQAVRDVAAWGGGKVQVGEELNCPAPLDGGSPGCFEAVGAGVAAALEERDRSGAPVLVGVNAAGLPDPAFWDQLTGAIGPHNTRRLDYVSLDAFPDVFRPIPKQNLTEAVTFLLQHFRTVTAGAGVPETTPIHITETGWPTDDQRTEDTQAQVLTAVADAVLASGAGVQAYEWFSLRDGLTTGTWTARFGLLRDDYTPKPAFAAIQQLIAGQTAQSEPARPGATALRRSHRHDSHLPRRRNNLRALIGAGAPPAGREYSAIWRLVARAFVQVPACLAHRDAEIQGVWLGTVPVR